MKSLIAAAVSLLIFAAAGAEKSDMSDYYALLEAEQTPAALEAAIRTALADYSAAVPDSGVDAETFERFLRSYMSYDALKDDLAASYKELYTPEECRALTAFYRSGLGRKKAENDLKMSGRIAELMRKKAMQNAEAFNAGMQDSKAAK